MTESKADYVRSQPPSAGHQWLSAADIPSGGGTI